MITKADDMCQNEVFSSEKSDLPDKSDCYIQYYFQCVINNIWTYLIDKNNQSRDLLLSLDRYLYPKLLSTM